MSSLGRAIATSLLAALAYGVFGIPILVAYLADSGSATYGILAIILVWPVFWVVCRLAVAVPVAVMEGSGPLQSLRRSWHLTRGRAFMLAAVFLVLGFLSGLAGYALGKIGIELFGAYGKLGAETLIGAILGALSAVSSAVIYHDLRVDLEGTDTDELAAIFA
jgi:membrane-anchored glycerophosphoryl diester phosphodiesterase (GDPDase)